MIALHAIANPAVAASHPNILATLYRSTGMTLSDEGKSVPDYDTNGISVEAQVQSDDRKTLYHADRVGMEEVSRKIYLYSDFAAETRVASIVRPLSRSGDFLRQDDGSWWLIDAVIEDFTRSGWVCVRATRQVNPPNFATDAP